jgi:hypothetical protein
MVVPVVYEDSLNIDQLARALEDAISSLRNAPRTQAQPATADHESH